MPATFRRAMGGWLDAELDEQAKPAAAQWKFKPGMKDGEPVNVLVNIELAFTLKK